jgi:hypothetical protein
MPKTYRTYIPEFKGSIEDEWKQCLDKILVAFSDGLIPVKLNIFADNQELKSFLGTRELFIKSVNDAFRSESPAVNLTAQPPEKPFKVAVEATYISSGSINVTRKEFGSIPYTVLETNIAKEVWAAGISSYSFVDDTRLAAEKAFELVEGILGNEGMTPDNLVRQWNYIANILEVKNGIRNYQVFNDVRYDFYRRSRRVPGFPAATGVGTKHGGVILDFCAISSGSVKITAVENPDQVNAYDYSQQILNGFAGQGMHQKHPPQFERALLIDHGSEKILHISGTASIIGQETAGIKDIRRQTLVTIGNIRKVSDRERLSGLTSKPLSGYPVFSLFRVYIKNQEDFPVVRRILNENFQGVPVLFVEADICRDNLLMEIEAEAVLS